jgi:hydroxyacylglutathione hydrolase
VVTDGEFAAVIDPQRDIDRVYELTEPRGLKITHVLETHNHNDYVTGGSSWRARPAPPTS